MSTSPSHSRTASLCRPVNAARSSSALKASSPKTSRSISTMRSSIECQARVLRRPKDSARISPTEPRLEARLRNVGGRQGEVERRPLADLALCPDAAAVTMDDPLHGGETDTSSLEVRRVVQSLEGAEELVRVAHVEPDAVVFHEEHGLAFVLFAAKADVRGLAFAREFPAIPEKVREGDAKQPLVARRGQRAVALELHLSLGLARAQVVDNGTRHLRQVHAARGHLVARETREQQHVVDEAAHAPGRGAHAVEVLPTVVAESRSLVLEQDLTEAVDAAQWRAQVMRDRVGERPELVVERAQLGHVPLAGAVEAVNLLEEAAVLEHDGGLTGEELEKREVVFEEGRTSVNEDGSDTDATAPDRERRGQHVAWRVAPEFSGKLSSATGVFGGDERALLDECRARQRFVEPTVDRLPAIAIEPQDLQIRLPDPEPGVGLTARRGKLPRQRRIHELRCGLAHEPTGSLHEREHFRGLPGAPQRSGRREAQEVRDP